MLEKWNYFYFEKMANIGLNVTVRNYFEKTTMLRVTKRCRLQIRKSDNWWQLLQRFCIVQM